MRREKLHIEIPRDILTIVDIFKSHEHKLFVVGGAVRDALLGKLPKDFDLATDALPDKVEDILAEHYKTLGTGKSFGVINVFTKSGEFEIATFREDSYKEESMKDFLEYLKSLQNGKYEEFIERLKK